MFTKATRKKAKLRLGLIGPSGSGKTYSALQIAMGLGGRIAMIDTERGSGELYSDMADYDVDQISEPFKPQKYTELIKMAGKDYDVIIIDSLSHAWAGEGGMLDMHDNATKASKSKNSYMAWREVTPHHNRLVDAILNSPAHIIVTIRSKVAYEIIENDKGKKAPQKIGMAPVFREGIDYEFTVALDLSIEGHIATASKDRTGLYDSEFFTPSVETGKQLIEWLNQGEDAPAPKKEEPTISLADKLRQELNSLMVAAGLNSSEVKDFFEWLNLKNVAEAKKAIKDFPALKARWAKAPFGQNPGATNNFDFLKQMAEVKKRIEAADGNDKIYYAKIGALGFEKSNQIFGVPVQKQALFELTRYAEEQEAALRPEELEEPPLQDGPHMGE